MAKEEFYFLMHESYYEQRSTTHGLKILEMYFVNSVLDNNNWDIKYDKIKQVTTNMTEPSLNI